MLFVSVQKSRMMKLALISNKLDTHHLLCGSKMILVPL